MIPFNIIGHSKTAIEDNSEPIVWVDSSDNGSYTISGNDVTSLLNKGTLGGVMTLNGSVKFANNGFESWSASDYITRDRSSANTQFDVSVGGFGSNQSRAYQLGVQSFIISYNLDTNQNIRLFADGHVVDYTSVVFNNVNNAVITLMRYTLSNWNSGANNPLHEFRLYDRAFSLTEMQDLQTELNNKYTL